jgi:glyoxalase family protein
LRRVKQTVNFDAPDVYHLYYGDEVGTPGTVMTLFPVPAYCPCVGPVSARSVPRCSRSPPGSLGYWQERLGKADRVGDLELKRKAVR